MGQIAFLMLMGVVMKNGILLVDYTNTLRERGRSLLRRRARGRPDAHAPGADDRGVDHLRHAAGRARHAATARSGAARWASSPSAAWSTSTFLTLLVVPVVYTLVDDAGSVFLRLFKRLWPGRAEPSAAA